MISKKELIYLILKSSLGQLDLVSFPNILGLDRQRMMHRAMAPQKYEKYRMKFIHLSPVLTMEGYCRNCNLGYPIVYESVLDYHEKTNFLPNDPIIVECPQCKNNSLHIECQYYICNLRPSL